MARACMILSGGSSCGLVCHLSPLGLILVSVDYLISVCFVFSSFFSEEKLWLNFCPSWGFDYVALVCGIDPPVQHGVVDVAELVEAHCTVGRVTARGACLRCRPPPGLTSRHAAYIHHAMKHTAKTLGLMLTHLGSPPPTSSVTPDSPAVLPELLLNVLPLAGGHAGRALPLSTRGERRFSRTGQGCRRSAPLPASKVPSASCCAAGGLSRASPRAAAQ